MPGRTPGRVALGAALTLALALSAPVAANAAGSLWVAGSGSLSAPGKSCISPGYNSIQAAIGAASQGATIHICPGTYSEQLTVTAPLKLSAADAAGSVDVVLPAKPADTNTPCDHAPGTGSYQADQDLLSICTAGTVSVTGLKLEAKWPSGTCYDSLYGILVAGGATLKASETTVDGAGAYPINGCQGGVGIQVGMAWTTPVEVGHAVLNHDEVLNYQKNGMTVDGAGSTAKITANTVTGAGATPETAQNGIQVSNGAQAAIKSSTITGDECDNVNCGSDGFDDTQATGVLFYGAGAGSSLTSSTLGEDDIGAYYVSQSNTQPTAPEVSIAKDVFDGDRYEAIALDQGDALLKSDKVFGPGEIGIDLFQYEGQSYAPDSSAKGVEISGMSEAAVAVETDNAAGDKSGNFTLSGSHISDNAAQVLDPSTTFTVTE